MLKPKQTNYGHILGGIGLSGLLYLNRLREREHAYNPQSPKDDYKEMYQWVNVVSKDLNNMRECCWKRGGTLTGSGLYRIPNKVDNEEEEKS